MAGGLQQTKSRIKSVSSTKKITKAMELVSTSKLKKAKDLNFKVTPFKDEVFEIMSYCAQNITDKNYSYFNENKESNKTLYIIVTSSLGLCGGYNVNINKFASSIICKEEDELFVIGSKGKVYFSNRGYKMVENNYELPGLDLKENVSSFMANYAIKAFDSKKFKNVKIICTKFINSLTFQPQVIQLLPLSNVVSAVKMKKELLLEPSAEEVLNNLIPFYTTTAIKTLIFESILSEQASRRTAMETATDNASELQDKLLLEYNKSRQTSITQEITEISGAANANK